MEKTPIKDVTIVWHLGWQKTGTTTFQSILRRNRDHLSKFCTLFPKRKTTEPLRHAGLAHWADPTEDTAERVRAEARAVRDVVCETGQTTGLFTDENVIGLDLYDARGGMVDMAAEILPLIETAIAPAKSVFVFYTRDWDKWFRSAYNQVVKEMRCTDDFDTWRAGVPFAADWDEHHRRLSGVVRSELVFRDLAADGAEGKPMGGYLLERAGVPTGQLAILHGPVGRNESLPPGALELMRDLNASPIHDRGLAIVRKLMLKHMKAFK